LATPAYVILVNYNSSSDTIECLESVLRSEYPETRIVVVDNGSTDGSLERMVAWATGRMAATAPANVALRHLAWPPVPKPVPHTVVEPGTAAESLRANGIPRITFVRSAENLGFAGGNNLALTILGAAAGAGYACLVNNDMLVAPAAITELIRALERDPQVAAIGGLILDYAKPELVQSIGGGWMSRATGMSRLHDAGAQRAEVSEPPSLGYVSGGLLLLRLEMLPEIGLMDESYFLYAEDADWGERMRARGYRLACTKEAMVWHKGGGTNGTGTPFQDYYVVRSSLKFVRKHAPHYVPVAFVNALLRFLAPKIVRRQWPRARAVVRAIASSIGVACVCLIPLSRAHGQESCREMPMPVVVGSEWEHYLRTLQALGNVSPQPWTLRPFTTRQWRELVPSDTALPWSTPVRSRCAGPLSFAILPVEANVMFNSAFPFGRNDGSVWAGRGVTAAATAGFVSSYGPLTVVLAPVAFVAQNASFAIQPNGQSGPLAFGDWRYPILIDQPQRFGDGVYGRVDPGQSRAEIDLRWITTGLSFANQFSGPATDHPILLGNNAAGFPHLFAQTSTPLRVPGIGRFHTRVYYGSLAESEYSSLAGSGHSRLASGFIAIYQPSLAPVLELGASRFFQVLQPRLRLTKDELLRPFSGLLSSADPTIPADQLASIFARVVFPSSGTELYLEFGREDANADLRELVYFGDHDSAYLLGFRKAWRRDSSVLSVRTEILNSRVTHLALSSAQAAWYLNSSVPQGFTHRGQVLGSAAAYGGGGAVVAVERYDRRGRWRATWDRIQLAENRAAGPPDLHTNDVAHVLGFSTLRFGDRVDYDLSAQVVYEFNRHFSRDAFNLHLGVKFSAPTRPSAR
jgi:GT2 family glycosyltransferase